MRRSRTIRDLGTCCGPPGFATTTRRLFARGGLLVATVLVVLSVGTSAQAAIARVQARTATGTTSATATWSPSTIANNFLAASLTYNCGSNAIITPPAGWTAGPSVNNGTTLGIAIYYYTNAPSQSSSAWSIAGTGCTAMTVSVHEYSGVATTSPLDQSASSAGTSTSPATGTTGTTTQDEALVFVGLASAGNPGFSAWTDSLTEVTDIANGTTINGATADRLVWATANFSGSASIGVTSRAWAGAVSVFRAQLSGTAKYWTGATSGSFHESRWSTTPGGSVNTGVPSTGDRAVFTGSTGSCSIGTDVTVAAIEISSTYTGTVQLGSSGFIATTDSFSIAGGTFDGNSGSRPINIAGAFTQTGGTFISTRGMLEVRGNFTRTGGTFNQIAGTFRFAASTSATITPGGGSFNNVAISGRGSAFSTTPGTITDTGLVGYWRLDETSISAGSTTATDSSGLGNHATYVSANGNHSASTWVSGRFQFTNGKSVDFLNGTERRAAQATLSDSLKPSSTITVSAWFVGSAGDLDTLGADLLSGGDAYTLRMNSATTVSFHWKTSAGWKACYASIPSALDAAAWHHLLAVKDAAGARVYLNGTQVSVNSGDCVLTNSTIDYTGMGTNLTIARHGGGSIDYDWGGLLDDVRVYNTALTSTQITNLYNGAERSDGTSSSLGSHTGLLDYLKFDNGSGTTAPNIGSIATSATLVNGPTWNTSKPTRPFFPNGSASSSMNFDGVDDYVALVDPTDTPTNYTVSLWIRPTTRTTSANIICRTNSSGCGVKWSQQLLLSSGGKVVHRIWDGADRQSVGITTISANTWYHVVAVLDDSVMRLFVNGAADGPPVAVVTPEDLDRWHIGQGAGNASAFAGQLDDVRIYNRALSAAEIQTLYSGYEYSTGAAAAGTASFTLGGALDVNGDLAIDASDTLDVSINNYSINVAGSFLNKGTFTPRAGSLVLDGTLSDRTLFQGGTTLSNLTLTGSGAWTLGSDLTVGSLTMSSGTFTAGNFDLTVTGNVALSGGSFNAPSGTLTVNGTFGQTGGTFTHNSGTVLLASSTPQTLTPTGTIFNNLTIGSASTVGSNPGLVWRWKFDEGTGTAVADAQGSNSGTLQGGALFSTDTPSRVTFTNPYSIVLDGSDDRLLTNSSLHTYLGGATASLAFWVKTSSVGTNDFWLAPAITGFDAGGSTPDIFWGSLNASGALYYRMLDDAGQATSSAINNAQWRHVVITRNATTGANQIYVDGGLSATATGTTATSAQTFFSIGALELAYNIYARFHFPGLLDDVRVYNTVLSSTEIASLYNGSEFSTAAIVANATYTLGSNLDVDGNFTLAAGAVSSGAFNMFVGGSWTNTGGTFTAGTGTVTFDGTGTGKTITPNANSFSNLAVTGSGAWTLAGALDVNGNYTQSAGTFSVGASNHAMTVAGDFDQNGGTFIAGSGTVTLDGNVAGEILRCSSGFYSLTVNGTGGSWSVSTSLGISNALAVTAGTLGVTAGTLTVSSGSATINGGSFALTSTGIAVMTPGLSMSAGALSLAGTTSLQLGANATLALTGGTLTASSTTSEIKVSGTGTYAFTANGATFNVTGLAIKNTGLNGLTITNASNATFTAFKNVAFSGGSTTAGARYLSVTANALQLLSTGLTFDVPGASTNNIHLAGNGDTDGSSETRLTVVSNATSDVGAGGGESRDSDDDANDDSIGDNLGSNGAVVQWVTGYNDVSGTLVGFPTAAFDWSTFTYYASYAAFSGDAGGSNSRIYVRNSSGSDQYSVSVPGTILSAPRWYQSGAGASRKKWVIVNTATTVYKYEDTGSALTTSPNGWSLTPGDSISGPVAFNDTYVVFPTAQGKNKYLYRLAMADGSGGAEQALATSNTVNQITSAAALGVHSGEDYAYVAANEHAYRIRLSNMASPVDTVTTSTTILSRITVFDGRMYYGDNVGKVWVADATGASSLTSLWTYQDTSSHGGSCLNTTCKITQMTLGFNLADSTFPRVYWGDADGHIYAIKRHATTTTTGELITGFPLQPVTTGTRSITAAPLYQNGIIVVGNDAGQVFVINQKKTALGAPAVDRRYHFGGAVSSVGRDASTSQYMVVAGGYLFYLPAYSDPDGLE